MISPIKSFVQYFRTYPLRGILTLLTIAIGVGALIITFSLSFDVNGALEESLAGEGRRIVIANAAMNEAGELEREFPSEFDEAVGTILDTEYENLSDIALVGAPRWNRVSAGDTSFQVRSAISATPEYANLMNLDMVAGSFFSADDVESRRQLVVISESTARIMFGSAQLAVGQEVQNAMAPPGAMAAGGAGLAEVARARRFLAQEPYTVIGVYSDVSELEREAFGVGDFIIPYGINIPPNAPISFDPSTVVMARLVGENLTTAESRIATILTLEYGDDTVVSVWEGSPEGPELLIEESRKSISGFALTINVLGVIILVASSIGIFSIMLVEVLGRTREIGLRRAVGATRAGIRRFFMAQALYFSLAGSAIGTGLAFLFYRVVGASLAPFFESSGLSAADLNLTTPGLVPVVLAVGAATIVGALFGFFPAVAASNASIVESVREDAA
jgi:putative ABC transport system permease protein